MDLNEFRRQKDEMFRRPDSPLSPDDQTSFQGLQYWPDNPALRLKVALDENVEHDFVMMQTSTGGQRRYVRAGKIEFTAGGETATLFLYKDDNGYFLPFRDGTSADESYEAGRYLEPEMGDDKLLDVDFNKAYNPYCAYSEHFSCPLPPRENWIKARIEAGEKKFHE
jgi:uncharacterized protein (DUF1684 family)